jgi:hypothetical protein
MDPETIWNVLMRSGRGGLDGCGLEWTVDAALASAYGPQWMWHFAVNIPGNWVEVFS